MDRPLLKKIPPCVKRRTGEFIFWGVLLLIWGLFEKDKWESLILLVNRKGGILKKGGCTCEGKRKYGVYIRFFLEKVWSCVFFCELRAGYRDVVLQISKYTDERFKNKRSRAQQENHLIAHLEMSIFY